MSLYVSARPFLIACSLVACARTSASKQEASVAVVVNAPADVAKGLVLARLASGLRRPVALESIAGDPLDRIFVVEQGGRVLSYRGEAGLRRGASSVFLDLHKQVSRRHDEQGLLGLAFHPDFIGTGRFYVNFTDRNGATRVVEYKTAKDGKVDLNSAVLIFSVDQPFGNHNGGGIEFGSDGKLYIGTGDGGAAGDPKRAGQDDQQKLAKMLRVDVDGDRRVRVVQKGLRNPWRYDFDRKTGDLYIADVGQDAWEEINVVAKVDIEGTNFGWSVVEGYQCFRPRVGCQKTRFRPPAVVYDHNTGCSVTGGVVYRGNEFPGLRGSYFYADYCTGLLRSFRWDMKRGVTDHWDWKPRLDPDFRLASVSSFGVDSRGEMYLLSLDGSVYKFARGPVP